MFDQNLTKIVDIKFENKKEVIKYLSQEAYEFGKISNIEEYRDAVIAREEVASTEIGHGVAIPHGESNSVEETFVTCYKLEHSVLWDELEVNLIFMIGVPLESREKEHLQILANLSRNLMNEEFRQKLSESKSDEELFNNINNL